ncbi:MAG: YwqG family protein [Thermodesulfobacteriota bacterium]
MTRDQIRKTLEEKGLTRVAEKLTALAMPCVRFYTNPATGTELPVAASKLGGLPDLPPDMPWPSWTPIEEASPLCFLGQINLAALAGYAFAESLPKSGMLSFFYDVEQFTWGFDPKDKGSWRVVYLPDSAQLSARPLPEQTLDYGRYEECEIRFYEGLSMPGEGSPAIEAIGLDATEATRYSAFMEEFRAGIPHEMKHQLTGHPDEVQGAMQIECQLASNGIYCGSPSGYEDPRCEQLARGARDWTLLLQLDTDDHAAMMWGDMGRLYFWIREEDLHAHDFDKVWMVLQCG